jgi:hypothetical protein
MNLLFKIFFILLVISTLSLGGCSREPQWQRIDHPLGWVEVDLSSLKKRDGLIHLVCRVCCSTPWEIEGHEHPVQEVQLEVAVDCKKQELTVTGHNLYDTKGNIVISELNTAYVRLISGEVERLLLAFSCRR